MENDDVMSRIRARMAIVRSFDYAPMLERIHAREREKWERIEREKAEKREAKEREKREARERREREKAEKREARERERVERYNLIEIVETDEPRPMLNYITILAHLIAYRAYYLLRGKIYEACRRCGYWGDANERGRRNYIERGLKVEQEWVDDHNLFYDWAMDNGYQIGLEMDRIDNDRGYFKDNIRFVSHKQNCRNTRKTLRLEDGTPFADWYEEHVGNVSENGHGTNKYNRLTKAFQRGGMDEVLEILNKINGL